MGTQSPARNTLSSWLYNKADPEDIKKFAEMKATLLKATGFNLLGSLSV